MRLYATLHTLALGLLICTAIACGQQGNNEQQADTPPAKELPVQETKNDAAASEDAKGELQLDKIKLPPGFKIALYAQNVAGARSMCWGARGTLFVGTRDDKVYALRDEDKDGVAEKLYTLATKLDMPNGVAFREGSLYVAEVSKVWRYDNIEDHLADPPQPALISDKFPTDHHHGWKYIAFGPDGWLYVPVGAPCNICESDYNKYSNIMRMKPDGSGLEMYAKGIRNTVGFAWHPGTNELWFTDNGRDMLGDNLPPDELNHAPKKDMHFGYPYCHAGDIQDPKFGDSKHTCGMYTPPVMKLGPHVAALGMKFYTGSQFPAGYKGQIFIAEHGSWNRSSKIGYRISLVKIDAQGKGLSYTTFAEGWMQNEEAWGRPVDLLQTPDGSLLVSDDHGHAIYKIYYDGK